MPLVYLCDLDAFQQVFLFRFGRRMPYLNWNKMLGFILFPVACATVVEFSEFSGLVVPVNVAGADMWASLDLSRGDSRLFQTDTAPAAPLTADLIDASMSVGDVASAYFSNLVIGGARLDDSPLIETVGYIGLGPLGVISQSDTFRLVRNEERPEALILLTGAGNEGESFAVSSFRMPASLRTWSAPVTKMQLNGRSVLADLVMEIDFQDQDTRIPLTAVPLAKVSVTLFNSLGQRFIACSTDSQDMLLTLWDTQSLVIPVKQIHEATGCRTNVRVDSGATLRVGFAFFQNADEILFDAKRNTVSFSWLDQLPAMVAPAPPRPTLPTFHMHPVEIDAEHIVIRFSPIIEAGRTQYVVKSLAVADGDHMRFLAIRLQSSPQPVPGARQLVGQFGPLIAKRESDGSVVLRAMKQAEDGFSYVVSVSTIGVEIHGRPTVHCPICLDSLTDGLPVTTLAACRHRGHTDCLSRWAASQRLPTCPVCRTPFNI